MFDALTGLIQGGGALGVFLLMIAENLFPPIPSELVMPLAGFLAAQGQMPLWLVILAGTTGSLIGGTFWYVLGRMIGPVRFLSLVDRYGRWLTLNRAEALAAIHWFERHGGKAVFLGRMVPTVRTLISVPAGLSGMPLGRFLVLSALGSLIWVGGLAIAGYVLQSQYDRIHTFLDPATTIIVGGIIAVYLWRVWTRR
jgi:membrane protein DedA with SNARE-associated domain